MNTPEAKDNRLDTDSPLASPNRFDYRELGGAADGQAALADETALAISYNGISQAVMMISPGHIEDFVTGFSLSNRIVSRPQDIYDIQLHRSGEAHHAQVEIASRSFALLKEQRRQLAGTSGCGLCGVEALEQALPDLEPLAPAPLPEAGHFQELRQRIHASQQAAQKSGAVHAALYLDSNARIRFCREDIGRHNALDKLIGAISRANITPRDGMVVITSRCSLELIQKAVRCHIGTLATLSAPTALAVRWARRYGLNLIHVTQHSAPRLYSPAQ
ncbi:formate dehydrogenase accessory protein FdhD [Alcanivorax hongdengensis A-11-3]|uniref:Sulfur carrier protein FdhD n=1 Tax=Alcanivorax hongdengensis A-11-3 TaxID=1177179 RepID=L0WEN2_9GAMM|nr:formate dehydrogenase accessory sulfurtransferase FdhD [Alcanivorax hongdengensis]EKF74617.1 formate dehydrogenase accessory protein FdhD [Alcanivorax hongdengensis A-11-3]